MKFSASLSRSLLDTYTKAQWCRVAQGRVVTRRGCTKRKLRKAYPNLDFDGRQKKALTVSVRSANSMFTSSFTLCSGSSMSFPLQVTDPSKVIFTSGVVLLQHRHARSTGIRTKTASKGSEKRSHQHVSPQLPTISSITIGCTTIDTIPGIPR